MHSLVNVLLDILKWGIITGFISMVIWVTAKERQANNKKRDDNWLKIQEQLEENKKGEPIL